MNFKSIILSSALGILIFCFASPPFAQTTRNIKFAGQWPFHPTKATVIDEERNVLFFGKGDRLLITNKNLNLITNFQATNSGQIGGIEYSASEQLIYAAARSDGLQIVNVSAPENPFKVGVFKEGEQAVDILGVHVEAQIAYLSCGISGVKIVNVSDPADTILLSNIDLPGAFGLTFAVDSYLSGNHLYVADIFNGVHIIDVSDPRNPEPIRLIAFANARDVFVESNFLFASSEAGGLEIVNISKPKNPTEASVYIMEDFKNRSARVGANKLYVGFDQFGLHVLDISDINNPVHPPAWEYTATGAKSITLNPAEQTAYITDDQVGLQKIDVTNPAKIERLAAFDTPADAEGIDIAGDFVYVLDDSLGDSPENEGLRILRITETNEVIEFLLTGFYATPGRASDVAVFGENAFIADNDRGLHIINVSDKQNPQIRSEVDTTGTAEGIFVNNQYTYIADGDAGLSIFDTGNPAEPELIAALDTAGYAKDIFVSGEFAFLADGENGLVIVNVSDPAAPRMVGSLNTPGMAEGVFVDNNFAYIADGNEGLTIVNATNKNAPSMAATFDTPGYAEKVSITGSFAFVADGRKGVSVIDISDPANPLKVNGWSYDTNGYASDVFSGYSVGETSFAFVADGPPGVIVLNPTLEEDNIGDGGDDGDDTGSDSSGCFIEGLKF